MPESGLRGAVEAKVKPQVAHQLIQHRQFKSPPLQLELSGLTFRDIRENALNANNAVAVDHGTV